MMKVGKTLFLILWIGAGVTEVMCVRREHHFEGRSQDKMDGVQLQDKMDGVQSQDEGLSTQHFGRFDRNSDGLVDLEEALLNGAEDAWHNTLDKFDSDGDMALSASEFAALCEERAGGIHNRSQELSRLHAASEEVEISSQQQVHALVSAMSEEQADSSEARRETVTQIRSKIQSSGTAAEHSIGIMELFRGADADGDGLLTQEEYIAHGPEDRFRPAHGLYHAMLDMDRNGHINSTEASLASAFEYQLLSGSPKGITSSMLQDTFAAKGWLRNFMLEPAKALANDSTLHAIVTALLELEWLTPGDDFATEKWQGETSQVEVLANGSGRTLVDESDVQEVVYKLTVNELMRVLTVQFCWRHAYDRGAGRPAPCASGYTEHLGFCFPNCGPGRKREWHDANHCSKPCPSGTTGVATKCRTNGLTKFKNCCGRCWPRNWCCRTHCCGGCSAGWVNTGCTCTPGWRSKDRQWSQGKTKYSRDVVACNSNEELKQTPIGHFCYPKPRNGFQCQLTACQQLCTHGMVGCGIGACARDSTACAGLVGEMAGNIVVAAITTGLLIASWGTAAPATMCAQKAVTMSKTTAQRLAKLAAKKLSKIKQSLADAVAKKTIKKAVKASVKKQLAKQGTRFSVTGIAEKTLVENGTGLAFDAIVAQIEKQQAEDMKGFKFESFELSGIATAVRKSKEGHHPVLQAQSWAKVAAWADPTGWVAAASAFMHPKCDTIV